MKEVNRVKEVERTVKEAGENMLFLPACLILLLSGKVLIYHKLLGT